MLRKAAFTLTVLLVLPALTPVTNLALAQDVQSLTETSAVAPNDQGVNGLRSLIADLQKGTFDPNALEPMPRVTIGQQLDRIRTRMQDVGELKSVTFAGRQNGGSVYDVRFADGNSTWVVWLAPNGKIAHIRWFFN